MIHRQRAIICAHFLLLALALVPIFLVEVPALVDYPNHLARMHILAELSRTPDLQAIYAANFQVLPNLAMDVLVPWLSEAVGITMAGKLFIALTLVVLTAGTLALGRAIHGKIEAGTLAVYLLLYNYVLSFGFLNYLFGVGLSLLLLASWIWLGERKTWRRLALTTAGAVVLFFCHLAAVATYALCIAGYELWLWAQARPMRPAILARRAIEAGAPLVPPGVLFLLFSPTSTDGTGAVYLFYDKFVALFVPALFYGGVVDICLVIGFILLFFLALRSRAVTVDRAVALPVLGLTAAIVLVPSWIFGNWGNDFRLGVPLLLILVAGCRIGSRPAKVLVGLGSAALVLFTVRVGTVANDWLAYDRLYREMRMAARILEPGSRVLPAMRDRKLVASVAPNVSRRPFHHAPALMLLERPIFLPTIFTASDRQPLSVQSQFAAIDVPHSKPLSLDLLVSSQSFESANRLKREAKQGEFFDRFAGWPETFDYVLMLDFGAPLNPLPVRLAPVMSGSYFTLYAINSEERTARRAGSRRRR